ncbi:MAG: orotate phosphoribosyltransferase [Desulfamplus sp.]|nr:orotate phosphoribosyltransferase [Desulfamplus sp.]
MKKRLIELLCTRSFKYSKEPIFKLASGAMSQFYVNCKPVTLDPEGMYLVGHLMFEAIKDSGCTGVGGLTFGADPIAVATSFASYVATKPFKAENSSQSGDLKNRVGIKAFSIRKEQKDHGVIQWVEGAMSAGEKVVIIDDVVTTGGSTIKAVERARLQGLDVIQVVTLVDRQEGGVENIRLYVDKVSSIVTRDDLMAWIAVKS